MSSETRPYRKKRRAELEAETRLRITESAMELHGSVGPSRTSISAVAERAGVRRSTVYRHFPDERALFAACSAHWMAANPRPDLEAWAAVSDPDERLHLALTELYAYFGRTHEMLENLMRDEHVVDAVRERFALFRAFLDAARDVLLGGRRLRGRAKERTRAAIGHAVALTTWRSLIAEQGLDDAEAVALMTRLVAAAAAQPVPSRAPDAQERR